MSNTTGNYTYSTPGASGGRKGWAKSVSGLTGAGRGSRAFAGLYINDGETPTIGTIVLEVEPRGSNKHREEYAYVGIIVEDGDFATLAEGDWRGDFDEILEAARLALAERKPEQPRITLPSRCRCGAPIAIHGGGLPGHCHDCG